MTRRSFLGGAIKAMIAAGVVAAAPAALLTAPVKAAKVTEDGMLLTEAGAAALAVENAPLYVASDCMWDVFGLYVAQASKAMDDYKTQQIFAELGVSL